MALYEWLSKIYINVFHALFSWNSRQVNSIEFPRSIVAFRLLHVLCLRLRLTLREKDAHIHVPSEDVIVHFGCRLTSTSLPGVHLTNMYKILNDISSYMQIQPIFKFRLKFSLPFPSFNFFL
jgi:hypothetical protein